ncbi:MAG: peptide-methionine (R)-S-oxide reductase MsrB [Pseudomonadota bacterium]
MNTRRQFLLAGGAGLALLPLRALLAAPPRPAAVFEVSHTEEEWRKLLTPDQFQVLRRNGTERPGSSPLNNEHRTGRFACAGCRLELFSSSRKFDSGTGWPSFWAPLDRAVIASTDSTFGMLRSAVSCRRCGGHLGHVFDDGPKPTGLRYCMNGVAMTFSPGAA